MSSLVENVDSMDIVGAFEDDEAIRDISEELSSIKVGLGPCIGFLWKMENNLGLDASF